MELKRDHFGQIIEPDYILTKPSNERIGILSCTSKNMILSFNAPSEISFETSLYIDGKKNNIYDHIIEGQYVEVINYGRFVIVSCDISSEGTMYETKTCNAISKEVLIGQKYLELFTINMGTTESIDNVQFYNLQDPEHSLLHLVLDKCPEWEIGHIDTSLMTLHRCFEETRTDIYSFLTTSMAESFQCIFIFDSYNNRIHVYSEDTIGEDTDIYVSYQNLLKSTSITSSLDDIKTCLTITGVNDLNLREVNMGYDKIYMLDYFATTEYMSQELYDAFNSWKEKWNKNLPTYTSLLSQYQKYYEKINYETVKKMPSDPTSTVWSEYGLVPLQEKQKSYETKLAVMIKAGQGDKDHRDYNTMYLPCFNALEDIKKQISIVQSIINQLKTEQSVIGSQMNSIISDIDMANNFTTKQLKELSPYIREEELSSDNYVVTDTMTDSERMDMLNEMLEFGQQELQRISQPQYQFSANLLNLYEIPEFDKNANLFDVGNYIHIILRDDYIVKAKILQINIDFFDVNNFNVTFGTLSKIKGTNLFSDITQAINTATSVSTTVSFNASHWNKANKEADNISQIISDGLLASGNYLKNGDNSELVIDSRGIFINTVSGVYAGKDSIFEGGGRILFTDNNWKTVSMSVGRADVTIKGKTESRFGTFADFVLAGYIGGSIIEGSEIYGGILQSQNYIAGKIGTVIDLNRGTFEFNANGESKLTLDENGVLTVKGTIKAERGWIGGQNAFVIEDGKIYCQKNSLTSNGNGVYIGTDGIALGANNILKLTNDGTFYAEKGYIGGTNGFVIDKNKLYNGKSSISDAANGIYLGTDGIALGSNSVFKVTNGGVLTATSGYIGGAKIMSNALRSDNENWSINSDGTAFFKNVTVTGSSSSLNIGGDFYLFENALNKFNELVAKKVTADYVNVTLGLRATYAKIEELESLSARVNSLIANDITAITGQIGNITSDYISASTIHSKYMSIEEWTDVGYIKADKINVREILSVCSASLTIDCLGINVNGYYFQPKTFNFNGDEYVLLAYMNNHM